MTTREACYTPDKPTADDLLGSIQMDETVDECMDRIRGRGRAMSADLAAAQDEIERRIAECEGHRALVDAVLAEREAETQHEAWGRHLLQDHYSTPLGIELGLASHRYRAECSSHRRAVADSIVGAA